NIPVIAFDHCGTRLLIRPDDFSILFRVELGGEFGGIHQITKHHGELAAFGVRCVRFGWWARRLANARSQRDRWLHGLKGCRRWRWRGGRYVSVPGPDQHPPRFIRSHALGLNEFLFEGFEGVVIQLELDLECTIRHMLTLTEDGNHLIEDGVKVHWVPFMCSEAFRNTGQGVWVFFVAHLYRKAPAKESRKCGSSWCRRDPLSLT